MANISITPHCNRVCEYCFAREPLRGALEEMTPEVFEQSLALLARSGVEEVRLLGGEPSLHPKFSDFLARALERGFRVRVFSNGLMPEPALRAIEAAPEDRVAVLINTAPPDECSAPERARQERTLQRLGARATLGLNIHSPGFQPDSMLELIDRYGLARSIRFGLAHPEATGGNEFLRARHYRTVGEKLAAFAERAQARGISLDFDCGFVPCMFPPGWLDAGVFEQIGTRCGAIPDVLPDGRAVPCYPLASLAAVPFAVEQQDTANLRAELERQLTPLRELGVFPECDDCAHRGEGRCKGGCTAGAMQRLRHQRRPERSRRAVERVSRPATAASQPPGPALWVVPYIDEPIEFWQQLKEDFGKHIREIYFPLPIEVLGTGRPPQPRAHVDSFLCDAPFDRAVLVNPITLNEPVAQVAPRVIEALRQLIGDYGISSATVSSLLLAERIRAALPDLPLAASVLADICHPNQALMLTGLFDTIVASSRIVRDLDALEALRAAFPGRIRLIVNEACLPGCPYRVQHFHEMGSGFPDPRSLCDDLLARQPWMRLTGSWILPQHLHLYSGVYDELKLAGRVTLRDPARYWRVLSAYIHRHALPPNEIGGGPASVLEPLEISESFFASTLRCGHACHTCSVCRDYWDAAHTAA